jgi:phosphoribosylaminoimidazole (AIR) synthetase
MGVGMCVITAEKDAGEALSILRVAGEKAAIIGEIRSGISGVKIE